MNLKRLMMTALLVLPVMSPAQAQTKTCKISVVGGSWSGQTYGLEMQDGKFVGASGILDSDLPGCVAKKYIFGRWYHLCKDNKIIVFKHKKNKWKRLKAKNLKKYRHDCL